MVVVRTEGTKSNAELDLAVRKLLRAEVEFTRAYTEWMRAPREARPARRNEVDAWEKRIEDAMREAQEKQDA